MIYDSSILVTDIGGYHLDNLVMEHCGTPIVEHIQGMPKDVLSVPRVEKLVKDSIWNVVKTLTEALAANVLHRDILPGNIPIWNRTAYTNDWGCAKLLRPPTYLTLKAEIAEHWSTDWDKVLATEKAKDLSTGTPLHMSTWLLLKAKTRSIYDDLESLLYVILDALSDRPRTGKLDVQPLGFRFYDSLSTAMTRITCTLSGTLFRNYFGVSLPIESTLGDVVDAMHRFLFFANGAHLGGRILDRADFPRNFNYQAAKVFMSDKTARDFLSLVGGEKDPLSLAVDTATTTTSAQISVHDSKPTSLPTPPYLGHSAERGTLGDDDVICMGSIAVRTSNSGTGPESPSPSGSSARVNTKSSEPSPSSRCNPAQLVKLLPAKNESRLSTPGQSSKIVTKKGTAQAGASRIPTRLTLHRNGTKAVCGIKKATTQVGHMLIQTSKMGSSPSTTLRDNSNVRASKAASLLKLSPKKAHSRTKASGIPRKSPAKENIGTVGKTKAVWNNSPTGGNKRTGSTTPTGAPAKRRKH
ncbi:hypothetical protein H4R27_005539 [Coemansia aciculifera]|nr:hypothetical protein H4R27_005539 [Coemansia aciculifera]